MVELRRGISRCGKNSGGQRKLHARLARLRHREAVRNRNECHRITSETVRRNDLIAIVDLSIDSMTRSARCTVERPGSSVSAKSGLNRAISEQCWGILPKGSPGYGIPDSRPRATTRARIETTQQALSPLCPNCSVPLTRKRPTRPRACLTRGYEDCETWNPQKT